MTQRSSLSSPSSSTKRLHDFTLPNNGLNWVVQRPHQRKRSSPTSSNSDHHRLSLPAPTDRNHQVPQILKSDVSDTPQLRFLAALATERVKEVTQKQEPVVSPARDSGHRNNNSAPENTMMNLESAVDGIEISMVKEKGKNKADEENNNNNNNKFVPSVPWRLRSSGKNTCKASQVNGGAHGMVASGSGVKKKELPKIPLLLEKEEIDEDIEGMTRAKPRRRPKRRPKAVQRILDVLVPGYGLDHITRDRYNVDEDTKSKKGQK